MSTPEHNCLHSERPECTKHDNVRLQTSTAVDFTRVLRFGVRATVSCFAFASALIANGRLSECSSHVNVPQVDAQRGEAG